MFDIMDKTVYYMNQDKGVLRKQSAFFVSPGIQENFSLTDSSDDNSGDMSAGDERVIVSSRS